MPYVHFLRIAKCGEPLPMTSSVMNALLEKHPKKREPVSSILVGNSSVSISAPHPIVFDQLDAICIRLKTSGAAGPFGPDAAT